MACCWEDVHEEGKRSVPKWWAVRAARGFGTQCGLLVPSVTMKAFPVSSTATVTNPSLCPHPILVRAVLSPCKNGQGFWTSAECSYREVCWTCSRETRMELMEGQSIPQECYAQFTQSECNTEQGLQPSVCPQEWGKDTSQGPEGTARTGQALPQWLKHSVGEDPLVRPGKLDLKE